MQAVIGALRANLGLDSAQFERGAKRAESSSQRLQKSLRKMATVATAAGAALGVATLAAGQTATEIRRLSQVANTAPDVLQRMAVGAKTVGIEQEKLSDILKDVNDRVGDFVTTGGGPMADFFEKIAPKVGITADAFRGLSGADALQLFVSSLEKANVSQAEMVFYMEAMASDSTLLLPLLRDNASEMNRLADSSASLGAIMSNETVASLDKMNMAVGEVSLALQGMRNRIAGRLAPALEMLAVAFTNSMREGGLLRRVSNALERAVIFLANGINVVVDNMGSLIRVFAVFAGAKIAFLLYSIGSSFIALARIIRTTGIVMVAFNKISKAKVTTLAIAVAVIAELTGAMDTIVGVIKRAGEAIESALPDSISDRVRDLADDIMGLGDEIDRMDQRGASILSEGLTFASSAADSLNDAVGKIATTSTAAASALQNLTDEAKEHFDSLKSSMEWSMESGFMSIIDGTASAKDAFRSFAAEVIKELYRVLVVQRLVAGISAGINTVASMATGNFFAGIPGKPLANGTSYAQGGMTLVGERGPELVNLPRGSQVIDAQRTASRMGGDGGGVTVNQTINVSTGVQQTVRAEIKTLMPQIAEASKAAVADAVRRGGSYGRAFA